jgi:hypothetical protein
MLPYGEPLSIFAFKFNLRGYTQAMEMREKLARALARFAFAEVDKAFTRWRAAVEAGANKNTLHTLRIPKHPLNTGYTTLRVPPIP